jgi:hypothetical protein
MKSLSNTKREVNQTSIWLQVHPSLGVSMMDHLYNKLDAMYPNRWASSFKSEGAIQSWRDTWAEAFDEERIMPHQVKAGISECRKLYDWPPSLTEFIKACKTTVPQMHRDFAPMLVHKMTPEERQAGLNKLKEMSEKLFEKVKA